MEKGIVRLPITEVLKVFGFNEINAVKIDTDVFSNQMIITVTGDLDRYPLSIEPIPERKAVQGL
jgi:hypothetical protein